jgi:hypothetical protein
MEIAEEGYFTSYVLDDFVIYRTPDIKPVAEESHQPIAKTIGILERGLKGQGEFELPSAVYVSYNVKSLGT